MPYNMYVAATSLMLWLKAQREGTNHRTSEQERPTGLDVIRVPSFHLLQEFLPDLTLAGVNSGQCGVQQAAELSSPHAGQPTLAEYHWEKGLVPSPGSKGHNAFGADG